MRAEPPIQRPFWPGRVHVCRAVPAHQQCIDHTGDRHQHGQDHRTVRFDPPDAQDDDSGDDAEQPVDDRAAQIHTLSTAPNYDAVEPDDDQAPQACALASALARPSTRLTAAVLRRLLVPALQLHSVPGRSRTAPVTLCIIDLPVLLWLCPLTLSSIYRSPPRFDRPLLGCRQWGRNAQRHGVTLPGRPALLGPVRSVGLRRTLPLRGHPIDHLT